MQRKALSRRGSNLRLKTEINTYLDLRNEYGEIENQQILCCAKSGFGKGLATEGIAEKFYEAKIKEFHNKGYLIISLADPKGEWESAFQMFKPQEPYHLDHLRKIGKIPEAKKVKLYHPFFFGLPNEKLPDINFFTISLKELGEEEWGLIVETESDTETTRLLNSASRNINKEDGIFGFVDFIKNSIKTPKEKRKTKKSFYIDSGSATAKAIPEIISRLEPFQKYYLLAKDNAETNIDWKKILEDQEHYHVFSNALINNEKISNFVVLSLLNGLLKNKKYMTCPVLILIPEINTLCPYRPEGHKRFLAKSIKKYLGMIRSSGKGGFSSILDTQVWVDVDEEVRNKSTITLLGELDAGLDIERIGKAYNFKREIREKLRNMEKRNSYIWTKEPDEPIKIFFSKSGHKEPKYSFFEMYKKFYPEKMKSYNDLIEKMKKMAEEDENKIKEKIKRQEQKEKEERERKEREKMERQNQNNKEDKKIEKVKEIESKTKLQLMKLCFEMFNNEILDKKERSYRKIAIKMGLKSHLTAKKYINEYGKQMPELSEEKET